MTTGLRDLRRLGLVDELRDLAESDDFVGTLLRSAQLADEAGRFPESIALVDELNELVDDGPFATVLAIEVLGAIDHGAAVESLTSLLSAPDRLIRRHAAWRLRRRPTAAAAVPRLLDMLVVGGID
ncbi:MAG: HEAT repeat domain-containing protein, partial [Ilumatobacteraceae bacterium]